MPSKKQTPAQRGAETRKRNREEKAKKSGKAFSKLASAIMATDRKTNKRTKPVTKASKEKQTRPIGLLFDDRLESVGVRSQRDVVRGRSATTMFNGDAIEIMAPDLDNAPIYYISLSVDGVLRISTGAGVRVNGKELSESITVAPRSSNVVEISRLPYANIK